MTRLFDVDGESSLDRGFVNLRAAECVSACKYCAPFDIPWPPNSVDAEDGIGFYRNLDGFLVTCGLDHIGGGRRGDASHFIHKHRKEVFNPLDGRISSQRALISGYGIDWDREIPVIWADAVVRQSSIFGEISFYGAASALMCLGAQFASTTLSKAADSGQRPTRSFTT